MRYIVIALLIISLSGNCQERGFRSVSITVGNSNVALYSQSHALLIGISDYTNGWPDLKGVDQDIEEVKGALEKNDFHVVIKKNLTKDQLDEAFTDFIAKYGQDADNRLLFYFAGHGHTIQTSYGDKLGYIVPIDAPNPHVNQTDFQAKAMEMAQIEIYAKRIQSKHALFLFDACFSGSLFAITRAVPEAISYKTKEPVRQFVTSGDENETVPDKSIFRAQFISAITTKYADSNNDGYLTGTELGEYLQTNVVNYSRNSQHPQYGKIRHAALDKGDFVFVLEQPETKEPVAVIANEEPTLGTIENISSYGSIEVVTEISGDLYLDGKKLGSITRNSKVPINKVASGNHVLEIKGTTESWSGTISVVKDQITSVKASNTALTASPPTFEAGNRFTDTRDGIAYKTIKIGSQIWMAENMNYNINSGSWCYEDKNANCQLYGRLYTWEAAQDVCPLGWRLPTKEDFENLYSFLGKDEKNAYKQLKADGESGFSAQMGGYRTEKKYFNSIEVNTYYWSSSPSGEKNAWSFLIHNRYKKVSVEENNKELGFSVRCIKN